MQKYYFALSSGSYSDYGVSGFYVADHRITEDEFEKFCDEQFKWEEQQLTEKGFTRFWDGRSVNFNRDSDVYRAYESGRKWLESLGSKESRFVKFHNLVALEFTELHRG